MVENVREVAVEFLLSGLIGGLLVFILGVAREWWRDEQERRGLLTLLLAEIEHNGEVIRTVSERVREGGPIEDLIGHPNFETLKMRTWRDVQRRAAALLPSDLMEALDSYYSPLETLLTLAGFPNMVSDSFDRTLRAFIQEAKPEWLRRSLPSSFDQDFGLRKSSPTKKDRGFNTPVLSLPRRFPLVWVGVWRQQASYSMISQSMNVSPLSPMHLSKFAPPLRVSRWSWSWASSKSRPLLPRSSSMSYGKAWAQILSLPAPPLMMSSFGLSKSILLFASPSISTSA
jgi:hypothetical protein